MTSDGRTMEMSQRKGTSGIEVHEATYTPAADGGEIRTQMKLGRHELVTNLSVADDEELGTLLEGLMVEVQKVTFAVTPGGAEIRASMKVGDRGFVSRVVIDDNDEELRARLDRLLDRVGQDLVQDLQVELTAGATEATAGAR